MTNPTNPAYSDLEQKYLNMNIDLYGVFTKYIIIGCIVIVGIEAGSSLLILDIPLLIVHCSVLISMIFYLKWMIARKSTYEISILIFYLLFYSIGLIMEYKKQEIFSSVYEAFTFGYGYALIECLMIQYMSNSNHKIFFRIFALALRVILIPQAEVFTYMKQGMALLLTVLTGLYRERHAKGFFFSYCNSKEQLNKFKNLVEEHIPEAIAIVSESVTKSLFVNNSFLKLVEGTKPNIESQLEKFLLKEDVSSSSSAKSIDLSIASRFRDHTLLDFIKTSSCIDGMSCIVTLHKKIDIDDSDDREHRRARFLFEVKLSKIIWDDQPCIAIILHDVTEHHTILSLKIADAQKDKVLATVSHELKTPLNGMLGMIQVMEKKIKDAELLRFLAICKSSTTLLVSLVCSILDLNQIRADKIRLNKQNTDVKMLLKEVISLFEYQCQQKGIYLMTKIEQGTPNLLYTDKERLSQVLINLIGNAQKFTSRGGILVNVSKGEEENSVRFSIEDTGIGISRQDQSKLFQIYGKLSQADERINRQGVGLGLTIAENLVKALNNNSRKETREIEVESERGRGSAFSFTIRPSERKFKRNINLDSTILPTIPSETEESPSVAAPYGSPLREHIQWRGQRNCQSKRTHIYDQLARPPCMSISKRKEEDTVSSPCILLVDDNVFNIAVAEHLVLSHGYRVKTALSGLDAIDIVNNNNHDINQIILILMDCQMPIMDGYEATKIIKKMMKDKKVPTIPIIALTANDSEGDREICRKAGMCDHLSKPLKDEELERMLKKYC